MSGSSGSPSGAPRLSRFLHRLPQLRLLWDLLRCLLCRSHTQDTEAPIPGSYHCIAPKCMDFIWFYGFLLFGGRGNDDFVGISSGWPSFFVVSACSSSGTCCRTSGKTIGSNRAHLRRAATKSYTWWCCLAGLHMVKDCLQCHEHFTSFHTKTHRSSPSIAFGWFLCKYNTGNISCCGWHGHPTPFYLYPKAMCMYILILFVCTYAHIHIYK